MISMLLVLIMILSLCVPATAAEEPTAQDFSEYNQPDIFSYSISFDPHQGYIYDSAVPQEFLIFGLNSDEICTIDIVSSHNIDHTLDLSTTYTAISNYVSFSISTQDNLVELDDLNSNNVISIKIIASTSNSQTYSREIYVIQSRYGLFVGYISEDYTIDLFYKWLCENGKITTSKYNDHYKARHTTTYDSNTGISTEVQSTNTFALPSNLEAMQDTTLKVSYTITASNGGETLAVSAALYWTDITGTQHPARNIKYEFYDEDLLGGSVISTGYTNEYGRFYISFQNDTSALENGHDLRISYYASSEHFWVREVSTLDTADAYDPYSITVPLGDDITASTSATQYYYNTYVANAFQIHQAMCVGTAFVNDMEGSVALSVVEYPGYDGFGCFYFSKLYIGESSYWSWDTILHEYGHAVASRFGFHSSIPANHTFEENLIAKHGKTTGTKLAWQEGWAGYFSYASQIQQDAADLDVPYVGDVLYSAAGFNESNEAYYWSGRNAETVPSNSIPKGEGNEGAVCRTLWDITDSSTTTGYVYESFDQLALGFQSVWNLITDNAPKTFSEFMSDFYSQYPISTANGRNMGGILGEYGFTATSLARSSTETTGGCVFFFTKPLEVSDVPNTYYLEFYGASMNLIRSIDITSYSQMYTMTSGTWSSLFATAQGKIYMCIKVVSTSGDATGPYYSAFITYPA